MIRALHHVQLAMPPGREDDARAFYRDVLGMTERPKPENLARRGGVWFSAGGAEVHLGVDDDFRPARKAHPALLVADLIALLERCRKAGCAVAADEPLAGYDRAYVSDPFGNRIELLEAKSGRDVGAPADGSAAQDVARGGSATRSAGPGTFPPSPRIWPQGRRRP